MLVVYILTGIILGSVLFAGIYYMGYRAGRRVYEEL